MKDYVELSNSISWKNKDFVQDILSKNKSLDLLYRDGKFFNMAIETDCIDIVVSLVNYFNNYQLAKYTSGTAEYLLLKSKLRSALETAIEDIDISQGMKEVLSPYIDFEDSEHNTLNDSFSDIDQTTFIQNVDKDAASNNFLNEEVLKKFEAEQNSQTKIIENLLGFGTEEIHPQIEEHNITTNVALSGNNT
ncbi:MAG: hypothetical protein H6910_06450, partial [Rickettsiaceae bacterium]|nr:hypothetical protein [Rickettsiaceae bacterium]